MSFFNFEGKIYKTGTPVIGPDNRGLRYGDGIFETIKVLKGKVIFPDEHFARLWKGMQLLAFDIPRHFSPEMLTKAILQLTEKNNCSQAARVRLSIYRGDGGLYDPSNHFPHYLIQVWPLTDYKMELNSNGLVIGIYTAAKKSIDAVGNIKHNNFLPYVLAAIKAKEEKWNDAIVLNSENRIADTSMANVFAIINGIIVTPSLKEACIAGVMRNYIIHKIAEMGWEIREQILTIEDLLKADEVFLTNSIYTIRWVKQIGDKEYTNFRVQEIFAALDSTI
jgi:branched-chain amino acid aminotransferase